VLDRCVQWRNAKHEAYIGGKKIQRYKNEKCVGSYTEEKYIKSYQTDDTVLKK